MSLQADFRAELVAAVTEARDEAVTELRVLPNRDLWGKFAFIVVDTRVRPGTSAAIADLVDACHDVLEGLWTDYAHARRFAVNRTWSLDCASLAYRIARLTLILGPLDWRRCAPGALEDGSYRALHDALGIDPRIDEAELAKFLDYMVSQR